VVGLAPSTTTPTITTRCVYNLDLSQPTSRHTQSQIDAMEQPGSNLLSLPELTPLEQEVLEEYERLAENMKKVRESHPAPPALRTHQTVAVRRTNQSAIQGSHECCVQVTSARANVSLLLVARRDAGPPGVQPLG
jgi:hypothetical protein